MTKLQTALISAAFVATLGTGIYKAHQVSALRKERETLRQQQTRLSAEVSQSRGEHEKTVEKARLLQEENTQLRRDVAEVPGLRRQIAELDARFRDATNRLGARVQSPMPADIQTNDLPPSPQLGFGQFGSVSKFADVGQKSPEAALETFIWATQNSPGKFSELVDLPVDISNNPAKLALIREEFARSLEHVVSVRMREMRYVGAYGLESSAPGAAPVVYPDVVELSLALSTRDKRPEDVEFPRKLLVRHVDGKWKLVLEGLGAGFSQESIENAAFR